MNISQWLHSAGKYMTERCPGAGRIDAEAIMGHVTGLDRVSLYRDGDCAITPGLEDTLRPLVERRAGGEPLAYITGKKEFMGLDFEVSPAVLIPRPETELLVEKAFDILKAKMSSMDYEVGQGPVVADVGTGSGAIAVTLAVMLDRTRVYSIDASGAALEVARRNAAIHGVAGRVSFIEGNLLEPLNGMVLGGAGRLDLVAANLPYVPSPEIPLLMADVWLYEPVLALDGGLDGLDLYRRLIPQAWDLLSAGGYLLMEIGPGQAGIMQSILDGKWAVEVLQDLAGRERLVVAAKKH